MNTSESFDDLNQSKASFEDIYYKPEPSAYFETLGALSYAIPGEAKPVLRETIDQFREIRGMTKSVRVLDVGCSYGVNSALLKFNFDMNDLYAYFAEGDRTEVDQVLTEDSKFFALQPQSEDIEMVGLDAAGPAVDYATRTGLLDEGIVADLESCAASGDVKEKLNGTDLVISTGCVGYVGEKTFETILSLQDEAEPPWIASFVLRMFPFDDIAQSLEAFGLETEKLEDRYFLQRSFADREERSDVLTAIEQRGLDPQLERASDKILAEFYLSRPKSEVRARPLNSLLGGPFGDSLDFTSPMDQNRS